MRDGGSQRPCPWDSLPRRQWFWDWPVSLPDGRAACVPRCQAVPVWGPFQTTLAAGTVLGPRPAHAGVQLASVCSGPHGWQVVRCQMWTHGTLEEGPSGWEKQGLASRASGEDPHDTELTTRRRTCKERGPELSGRTRAEGEQLFLGRIERPPGSSPRTRQWTSP